MDTLAFILGLMAQNTDALGFIPASSVQARYVAAERFVLQTDRRGREVGYLLHGPAVPGKLLTVAQHVIDIDKRNLGFGQETVNTLIDRATRALCRGIVLRCADDLPSNDFWRRCGFEHTAVETPPNRRRRAINIYTLDLYPTLFWMPSNQHKGTTMTLIDLDKIRLDGGTQSRVELDYDLAASYADALRNGDVFPAVTLYYDGAVYWLADGFHRFRAHALAGREQIEANVRQGTQRDATLFSTGANIKHGKRPTSADMRQAIERLLVDEEWGLWSDRRIAQHVGSSAPTVGKVRAELAPHYKHLQSSIRIGADGREIDTAKIGAMEEEVVETAPEAESANDWAEGFAIGRFWGEVHRCGLDRYTVLEQLQPGASRPEDLTLTEGEAWAALRRLGSAHVAAVFPVGSYVKRQDSGDVVGQVVRVDVNEISLLPPGRPHPFSWQSTICTPATKEEYDAYAERLASEEHARQEKATKQGKKIRLKAEVIKPHARRSWQERYARVREGVHALAVLQVQSEQGAVILGEDAKRAAAASKRPLRETPLGPALVSSSQWGFEFDIPAAGLDLAMYDDKSVELARFLWAFAELVDDKPRPPFAPGDLVKHKKTGRVALMLSGSRYQVLVKLGGFQTGKPFEDRWMYDEVELVEAWVEGSEPLKAPLLPLPDLLPTPWTTDGTTIKDAEGFRVTSLYYSEKPKGFDVFMANHIAEAVNAYAAPKPAPAPSATPLTSTEITEGMNVVTRTGRAGVVVSVNGARVKVKTINGVSTHKPQDLRPAPLDPAAPLSADLPAPDKVRLMVDFIASIANVTELDLDALDVFALRETARALVDPALEAVPE